MLKTQITGAKYLSPQTNQMTNLNIAIPADSKDTEFGTSDILLAKDVVTYLNALDSDISKELDAQTDKINKINLSIKQLIDHNLIKIVTELPTTDIDKNCIYLVPNKDGEGNNVFIEYIYVESKNTFEEVGRIQAKVDLSDYYTKEETDNLILIAKNSAINIHSEDNARFIKLDVDDTEAAGDYGSYVNASLTDLDNDCIVNINTADGFRHKTDGGRFSNLFSSCLLIGDRAHTAEINSGSIYIVSNNNANSIRIFTNKKLTDDEQADEYSPVDISLTDGHNSANINTGRGFTHKTKDGLNSSLDYYGLYVDDGACLNQINSDLIVMSNGNVNGSIEINANKELTEEEQKDLYSKVDLSLNDGDNSVRINANNGLSIKDDLGQTVIINANDGFYNLTIDETSARLDGYGLILANGTYGSNHINSSSVLMRDNNDNSFIALCADTVTDGNFFTLGTDNAFKISRPTNNTEGATITGVKSITAFANPSATKVWATDGSTVDLTTKANASDLATKANTSDVLLKKSASGGYYIESNNHLIGWAAFAANLLCTANGSSSFAEGCITKASGNYSHAEGYSTTASGTSSHAEGENTIASGSYSHAEGNGTKASGSYSHAEGSTTYSNGDASHSEGNYTHAMGFCSHAEGFLTSADGYAAHALGVYNVDNKNAIHTVGIGKYDFRKNAEYIYVKNNTNGTAIVDDPKNGYKYLIGVGGYNGFSTDNTTYKSVQEVIADLTSRIEQLETKVRALEAANTPA